MNLSTAESAIVARLQALITGATAPKIQSFPNNPAQYFARIHANGAILVRYQSSTFEEPRPNRKKVVAQMRTARWLVTMVHRHLNPGAGHGGIYATAQDVRQALTGYTVTGETRSSMMYPVRDGYTGYEDGVWYYEMEFEHTWPEDNTT